MLDLVLVGIGMILAGFFVVFLALVNPSGSAEEEGRQGGVRGGGVVMIGPIPIIFGSDSRWASVAIILAIVLTVVALLFGVLAGR